MAALRAALAGRAALVDQSDGRIIPELAGERVRDALAKGIPVDLDAGAYTLGSVAQTMAAHIGPHVSLMTERTVFEVVTAAGTAAVLPHDACVAVARLCGISQAIRKVSPNHNCQLRSSTQPRP